MTIERDNWHSEYYDHVYMDDDGPIFERDGSALRRTTGTNPRNLPCPTCGESNRLTPKDAQLGYQCDTCADQAEGGGW